MNLSDVLILAAIAVLVVFAIRRIRKGKSSCCETGCTECPCGCGRQIEGKAAGK